MQHLFATFRDILAGSYTQYFVVHMIHGYGMDMPKFFKMMGQTENCLESLQSHVQRAIQ